jgi:hypothetical protein
LRAGHGLVTTSRTDESPVLAYCTARTVGLRHGVNFKSQP